MQHVFNTLVRQGFNPEVTHKSSDRLFLGFDRRLAVGVLPVSAFASGHTYHVQHLYKVCSSAAFLVYANSIRRELGSCCHSTVSTELA